MKKTIALSFCCILLLACKEETKTLTADEIVDRSIEVSGGNILDNATASFDFRGKHYTATRNNGQYILDRFSVDGQKAVCDQLSNKGFTRFIDARQTSLPDSLAMRYGNSVNSVHYFAYLPYGLNAAAARKQLLGEKTLKGKGHYVIQVTFIQEGGGTDFEDVFLYWVDKETFKMNYLAYEYHVNGGGKRFREAYNERIENGVRFVDYRNFKPTDKEASLYDLDSLYASNSLQLLSKIELENVDVLVCESC